MPIGNTRSGNTRSRNTRSGQRSQARAQGFTLVELLVVVAIIGLLAALLLPAIGRARVAVYNMQVNTEISQMAQGLRNFNTKYGSLPPDFSDVQAGTPWNQSVAYRFIRKTWPKINPQELLFVQYLATNPAGLQYLDNDTCLWFWLSGMSESSTNPFTGPGGPLSANSLNNAMFSFEEARVKQARPVIASTDTNNPTGRDIVIRHYSPSRIDKPYIYFDSRTYAIAVFDASSFGTDPDVARPYFLDPPISSTSTDIGNAWADKAEFQVLASGRDELFAGAVISNSDGIVTPVAYTRTGWHPGPTVPAIPADYYDDHLDNFTSFGKVLEDFERP